MQSKDDKTTTKRGIFGFSREEMHQMAWGFSNFTAVAGVTSASIVAVQSPAKTILVNLTKYGTAMPVYSGGTMGFFRAFYAGTSASLSSSVARTAYVTNAKNHKPVEVISEEMAREEGKLSRQKIGYVMAAAFGDIVVTQIPESLSTLKKVQGLLPENFKWHTPLNMVELMKGGFGARYTSGMVNFSALCVVEDMIAQKLPDSSAKHFYAGALSGATAAVISYPCTALKDLTLVKSTVSPEGQLSVPSTSSVVQGLVKDFKENPAQVAKTALINSGKQLLVRAPLTATIFGIISFIGDSMGPEPLKEIVPERFQPSTAKNPQGFFGGSSPRVEIVEEAPTATTEASTQSSPKVG
ncbi:hypothetical protein [Legionella maioricensis]|uniref:Periplasmic ligand-binding sensor domain protein n=1 Tax=Legionella maioricensis TaxID=2896528 RepID=A0A9X2D1P1_9GAMM|nr:hypothetical protein [Legionella maioricensis]MCL9684719.1 hypothetical protein [Legionella maioricensis]MCL9687747.1 hypothetical protein [Legionella maioricensis]